MSGRRRRSSEGRPVGIDGTAVVRGRTGIEKVGCRLAVEQGDGMLVLCARDAEICGACLGGPEIELRLRDGLVAVDAGRPEDAGEVEDLAIQLDGSLVLWMDGQSTQN
jgi:hypothetical protein